MPKFWEIIILTPGLLVGAWDDGNYTNDFRFIGVHGYEATAEIELLCSITLITVWGLYHYLRLNNSLSILMEISHAKIE